MILQLRQDWPCLNVSGAKLTLPEIVREKNSWVVAHCLSIRVRPPICTQAPTEPWAGHSVHVLGS